MHIGTQITFTDLPLNKELFQPIKNHLFKPLGGLWTCTYLPNYQYESAWQWFCDIRWNGVQRHKTVLDFKKDTRICQINSYIDLRDLTNKYLFTPHPDLELVTSFIDFEKLSADYDVVNLTPNGLSETNYSFPLSLWGWDVECCLIMDFNIINIIKE